MLLYMPGFQSPLTEWSPRALEQLRDDLLQQRATARTKSERDDVEARISILKAEAKQRSGDLSAAEVDQVRANGGLAPFNHKAQKGRDGLAAQPSTKQLTLALGDGRKDRSTTDRVQISADSERPPPDRAERDGMGLDR